MGRNALRAPTREELVEVRRSEPGITIRALAERYGFENESGMRKVLVRYGLHKPSGRRHAYEVPWRIRAGELRHRVPLLLRVAGRIRRGEEISKSNRSRVNSLRRLVDRLYDAEAALTYDPESIDIGDDLWPWWAVRSDPSDRLVEIPDIGTLRLSLWHIPPSALSAEEAEALTRLKIKKGVT